MSLRMYPSDALLRVGLIANAIFSTACAFGLLVDAHRLGHALAVDPWILRVLAIGLIGFGIHLVVQARRTVLRLRDALLTSLADYAWVAASAVFALLWPGLTTGGVALVAGVALGVGGVGTVQLIGLRRAVAEPDEDRRTHHCIMLQHVVAAPSDAMWAIVADMAGIRRYSDDLTESFLRAGATPGPGAVRECVNRKGHRWAERCVAFEPPHSIELEFQTQEPGFPFPMRRLLGGWSLEPKGPNLTEVTVWWSFTAKTSWAGPVVAAVMSEPIRRDFPRVLERMAHAARTQATATHD